LQRHDFARLAALKRERRLRFVFLFYDLLRTLPDDDPRLVDPSARDLPSTDFMLREADLILSISRFSAGELAKLMERRRLTRPPVEVIRLAGRVPGAPATAHPPEGLRSGGFCLVVGDVAKRKNHVLLFRLWRRMLQAGMEPLPIVVAGRVESEMRDLVRDTMADTALAGLVRLMPNVDDDLLGWLYTNCRFTLFPSLTEGFGLPVAESLAAGKVAIASNTTAIPEAGQGFALSIDPHDENAWFSIVGRLMQDDEEIGRIETAIRAGFRVVSWKDTAADVLTAIGGTFGRGDQSRA
jgi:glycosyltransferase involved in cell wall biosynthesis